VSVSAFSNSLRAGLQLLGAFFLRSCCRANSCSSRRTRRAVCVLRPRIKQTLTFWLHHIVPGHCRYGGMVLDVLFAIILLFLSATVLFGFLGPKPRDTAFLIVGVFMLTAIGAVWLFI
jgi:hypothetical protein